MIDWILNFKLNSMLGILLYWVPLTMCMYGYTVRTFFNCRNDINKREQEDNYSPTETIGDIVGRIIVTVIPVGNLLAAMFDIAPKVFYQFFVLFSKIFDQPLVPKKKK